MGMRVLKNVKDFFEGKEPLIEWFKKRMSLYKLNQEDSRSRLLLDLFSYGVSNAQPRNIIGNFFKSSK